MSEFSTALEEIINRSFQGNGMELCRKSDIPRSVLSKLQKPTLDPSSDRLQQLAGALNPGDRRQLLLAAARDLIPLAFKEEVFGENPDPAAHILRGKLPPDVSAVIAFLERDALKDPETITFLRRIGRMASLPGMSEPQNKPVKYDFSPPPASNVAEDDQKAIKRAIKTAAARDSSENDPTPQDTPS